MTVIINRTNTLQAMANLRGFFSTFLYPRLSPIERTGVETHLAWIEQQPQSYINVRFETVPQLHLTRLTLEISHVEVKPFKPN